MVASKVNYVQGVQNEEEQMQFLDPEFELKPYTCADILLFEIDNIDTIVKTHDIIPLDFSAEIIDKDQTGFLIGYHKNDGIILKNSSEYKHTLIPDMKVKDFINKKQINECL